MYAFARCSSLGDLDLSGFTAQDANVTNLFYGSYATSFTPMKNYSGDAPKAHPSITKVTFSKLEDHVYAKSFYTPSLTLSVPNGADYVWGNLWGKNLIEGDDYTVSYAGNYAIGTAKVTVKGMGVFTGSKTLTFNIVPKGTSITKLVGKPGALKVTWKKQAVQTNGYELRYRVEGASTWKTAKANSAKTTSKKIAGLSSGKKYEVQVRTFKNVGKAKYYSTWSASKAGYAR